MLCGHTFGIELFDSEVPVKKQLYGLIGLLLKMPQLLLAAFYDGRAGFVPAMSDRETLGYIRSDGSAVVDIPFR